MKESCHGGAKHSAGASYPVEEGGMTARDAHLPKFKYSSIGAKDRCYRPNRFSWIGDDRGDPCDQISHRMFKPGIEAGSDHFLSGRPRGDRKPDDTYPSYHLQGLFHIAADIESGVAFLYSPSRKEPRDAASGLVEGGGGGQKAELGGGPIPLANYL